MDAFYSESVQLVSSISSDENLTESCNGFILKENLTKAVNLGNHGALVDFAWGSEMFAEKISLKDLKLKERDESFQIPVTLNNIGTLNEMSQCRSLKHTWEIDASKVCCSTLENLNLSSLVVHNLQLPMEMKITTKFSKLILYNGGNGFIHSLGSCCAEGKFGTATLQVPVEGGHEGGNLNVEYEGRKKRFESHETSDAIFYLTAFYDSCEHFIEPISRGYKLVLVYDLLWTNATNEIPRNFPVFLGALKQIKESLHPWRNRYKLLKSKMENEKPQNLVEEKKEPTVAASEVHQDSTEPMKSFKNEENVLFGEKTIQENVFLFVLQETYEENILSFLLLQGQDRVFADILLNCDFLDVHLANATQSGFEVKQGKVDVIEISRVIDSDDITRNLSIKLQWDKNFVGIIPSDPKKILEEDTSEDNIEVGKRNLNRGVLLIWPKYFSVQIYCRYGLHSLLVRIGTSLKSTARSNEEARTKTLPDFRQLISYCCAEPREVWKKSGMKKGEVTQRLFDFCTSLRAREEGLHLLKNLALNFDKDSQDTGEFEGIQTEDVALTIAKFEHQVCGWNMIAETIRALVKPNRIAKQLVPITKLAKHFLRFHCFDGAKTVGDCISSLFAEMDPSLAWQSKCCDVEAVVDMVVALESNPETSSRKRVKSFALFFSNLRPSLQCHLLLNFESQHGFRLRTIPSWQFIYQDVCAIFSESSNTSPPPLKCMAVDFMNGIQIWLSKLREQANLRPELRDSIEPNVDATDPGLEHTAAVSLSQKSNNPSVELKAGKGGMTTDWIAASDAWDSTTSTLIAAASQTKANAGTLSTDDWCEKTNSQSTNSNEKEASPCVSKSTNDWDACADAWASSSSKTPRNEVKAITNVDQSSWGATCKLPASRNSKTPSDDWDSWSTTSNSAAPKSNIVPISGGNDDWSTSADAWGASKGTNAGNNQSNGWGSTETVKSSWTSGYNASRDGRGSERKPLRPCFKCNEEGHMSYNCPTNPNRGRGGGRGSGRGGGTRVCFKCNEEGHMSYDCPTGPTRGRGGGRGGGSTRPCYKCNQEGHTSYNCPTASRGGIRSSPASGYGASNSSTSQPVFDDWGTLTATSGTRSSSYDSGDKKDDWGSSSGSVSSPWANDSNAAARGGRSTPRSSAPFRDSQPVVDDWGISSIPSTAPIIKPVSHTTTGNSGSDDWDAAADAWSAIDTTKSTSLSGNSSAAKVGGDDWGLTAKSSSSIDTTKFTKKSGNSSAAKAGGDDWGSAADAWSSVNTSSSNPRSGNSSIAKAGGLNCSVVDDSWDKCPSASNSEQGQLNITRNRPNSIVKPDEDDWGRSADVSKRDLISSATVNARLPPMDDGNVNGFEKRNDQNFSSYRELNQSIVNAISWNGPINHGNRSFKTSMKNVDVNPPPVPASFEMPKSMRVMGTIEPEKVWTYLKRVKQTTNESIGVFEFSPATTAEVDGYKFFFNELHGMNWFAVIADTPDSKLPCCFKDFYVIPLGKDSVVPLELTSLVKKSFLEQRTSDLLLGVVVFRIRRFVDQSNLNPSLPEKTYVPDTQIKMESESNKIQAANSSEPSQVASAHPPTRMAAIRQKLQQDILSVDPVKAKVHTNSSHLSSKSPSSRHPSVTKSHLLVSPKEFPLVPESREGKMPAINVPFIPDKPVDGEMLMQKAILEELSRQIGATKHGKSTEVGSSSPSHKTESYSTGSLSGVEPPFTRSKSKRKSIDEEISLSKRPKQMVSSKNSNLPLASKEKVKLETEIVQLKSRTSSRRSSNASPHVRLQCVIEGCSSDAQTNSVYCSDECIANHVRDSLHAMSEKIKSSQLQEPQSPIDSLTPPVTSSDESLWKDSVDYTLLVNQPTPALASKLLAITQRRKSLSSNPPNLAGDTPIPVIETKTGKVLRGPSAPNVANVEQWLKDNATYTIMKPESPSIQPLASIPDTPSMTSSSNVADSSPIPPSSTPPTASSLKSKGDGLYSKKSSDLSSSKSKGTRKRSTETNKEEETPTKMAKSDPESTRSFSRSSLKDALWSRCKEANDLELNESIVEQVATEIEDSLFSFFKKDVGSKYKNKYRSLIYNIKDPKNPGLFREIITKQINPGELVKMSTEDLAYKDLAEWRENEAKRQLDLIEKNEQENMGLSNRYLIKTHKGEEIIENVCKEVDGGEEISVKIEIALPELANDTTPQYKSQRIAERSRSSLSSSHSIKEKDRNNSSSSRSSREKVSSRSSKSSRRHSDSGSKRSDHHRSDRDKKKDTKERDHHRSSKRRDEHHYNSDRDKKREKERKKDIPEQAKSSSIKKVVVDEELYDPSQPLNSDDDVPIPAAFEDELALQKKLSKQQAVLEELNHQNQTSSYTQRVAESAIVNSVVALLPKVDETGLSKIAVTTSLRKASRSEERQYRLLTDYSDDENVEKPEETVVLDEDMNRHHDLVMESDPAVGTVRSFNAQDEANPFYSPGNLLIAEDEEPIIDFEEQILKEQVVIEELNSNLTSFIVNNLHIESHDTELDANTSSEMVTSDVKEPDVPDTIEHSTSTAISCMDTSSVNLSADPVFDQSTQSTSSSHLEDPITTTEQEEH